MNKPPVAIEHIEKTIIEKAFDLDLVKAKAPVERSGKKVAVIGSGPAGLAAAAQLNKAGHWVTVFERADRIGGLLRYGIPDFKLEKWVLDRRIDLMSQEGIRFKVNADVGTNLNPKELQEDFDSILICTGATKPRDLPIEGRELKGVEFAMDFLTLQNKTVAGDKIDSSTFISAKDKNVLVIGGGDTGSDCVGTSHRHGAKSVTQIELLSKPLNQRTTSDPWPLWPMTLRTSSSHEEGGTRDWSVLTKEFIGNEKGEIKSIKLSKIEWYTDDSGRRTFKEIQGSDWEIPCDLALLAIGFTGPEKGILDQFGVSCDGRGNVYTNNYQTNLENVFAAGDSRRGQSLVVWAISEGREAAVAVDEYLTGESALEQKEHSFFEIGADSEKA